MRLRYAINVTIDGCVHHEAGLPPDEDSLVAGFAELGELTARLHQHTRRWEPPADDQVATVLASMGARSWQIGLTAPLLTTALHARPTPKVTGE